MHLTTCRPGEASPNDGYSQGAVPGRRWWEESKGEGWAARIGRARKAREERYLLRRAGSWPRKSGPVSYGREQRAGIAYIINPTSSSRSVKGRGRIKRRTHPLESVVLESFCRDTPRVLNAHMSEAKVRIRRGSSQHSNR